MRITFDDFKTCKGYSKGNYLKAMLGHNTLNGHVLEFGVWKGISINLIAEYFSGRIVHGFDSFEGLPEDWYKFKESKKKTRAKRFRLDKLPEVRSNVILYKGWFDDTLPIWVEKYSGDNLTFPKKSIAVLHIDSDLYSSAKTVLTLLNHMIVKNTIIMFDELCHWGDQRKYSNWEEHEWKALTEWCDEYNRDFEPIGRTKLKQAAIRVL